MTVESTKTKSFREQKLEEDIYETVSVEDYCNDLRQIYSAISIFSFITSLFYQFIEDQTYSIDSTFTILTIGMKRSGKTLFSMTILHILMKDPKRKIALYKCPYSLYIELNLVFPDRIIFARSIAECDFENAIIYVDEGALSLSAKKALTADIH